jgi:hypothetical protein
MLGATPAFAAIPALDFGVPGSNPGAVISYAGGATPLVGTNITVANVLGLDTPLNDLDLLTISNGKLNFTTGNWTSSPTINDWEFASPGPVGGLTIVGGIASLGIANGTALLTGQIKGANVSQVGSSAFKVAIAFFINTVDATLAAHYGLLGGASYTWTGDFNIGFSCPSPCSAPGAFTSSRVTSGDVITSPVPEPSTMAVAGLGALGLIGYGIRRRRTV